MAVITSHRLEPVHIAGLQQVWVSNGSAGQDLPEEVQIFLSHSGEGPSVWGRGRRAVKPALPGVQLLTAGSTPP